MTKIFDRIEVLNKKLQMSDLSVIDSCRKIEAVTSNFEAARDFKFEAIWA